MPTPILRFNQEKPALLLLAYLKQQNIDAQLQQGVDSGFVVHDVGRAHVTEHTQLVFELSIVRSNELEKAQNIAKQYLASPSAWQYQHAAWEHGIIANHTQEVSVSFELESWRHWRSYLFTHFVGIACIIVFLLMNLGLYDPINQALQIQYLSELQQNGQWYRIFGPNFMHGSAEHIVMNLCWWWLFASHIEHLFGTRRLVLIFIIASVFANCAQLIVTGPNFLGLSGINYAIFGFMWWIDFLRPKWGLGMPTGLVAVMLLWIVVGYADVFAIPFANEAHLFGLIAGCLMALLFHKYSRVFSQHLSSQNPS